MDELLFSFFFNAVLHWFENEQRQLVMHQKRISNAVDDILLTLT